MQGGNYAFTGLFEIYFKDTILQHGSNPANRTNQQNPQRTSNATTKIYFILLHT